MRILFLLCLVLTMGQGAEHEWATLLSRNEKTFVRLDRTGTDLQVQLFEHPETAAWKITCKTRDRVMMPMVLFDEKTAAVVLVSKFPATEAGDGALILLRNGSVLRSWTVPEIFGLRSFPPAPKAASTTSSKRLTAEETKEAIRSWEWDGILCFLDEEMTPARLFIWLAGAEQWLKWNLTNGNPEIISTAERLELNRKTRQWAKDRLAALPRTVWPNGGYLKLGADSSGEARTAFTYQRSELDREAAYCFLAALRIPPDRVLIERLIHMPLDRNTMGVRDFAANGPLIQISASSSTRDLGDYLLALWDGKLREKQPHSGWGNYPPANDGEYFSLGSLRGFVVFPFPPEAGSTWIYLLPAHLRPGDWRNRSPEAAVFGDVYWMNRWASLSPKFPVNRGGLSSKNEDDSKPKNKIAFSINGVSPGEYKIVAIWNKTYQVPGNERVTKPPPSWDYESVESSSFTLTNGSTVHDLILVCTNQAQSDPDRYIGAVRRIARQTDIMPILPQRLSAGETGEIQVAIFSNVVKRLNERSIQPASFFVVSVVNQAFREAAPGPELLGTLSKIAPTIPVGSPDVQTEGKILDKKTGRNGVVVVLGPISRIDKETAEMEVTVYRERQRDFTLGPQVYRLMREHGHWTVLGIRP